MVAIVHPQIAPETVDLKIFPGPQLRLPPAVEEGEGGFGTRPWWLALLACGAAYWPLAFQPSAMTSRPPHYCGHGHPHCRGHPPAWGGNPECNCCPWRPPLTAEGGGLKGGGLDPGGGGLLLPFFLFCACLTGGLPGAMQQLSSTHLALGKAQRRKRRGWVARVPDQGGDVHRCAACPRRAGASRDGL